MIHAKGTGMELAKKYLGVSLVEEKEVILIVTKSREKNQIMKQSWSRPVSTAKNVRLCSRCR